MTRQGAIFICGDSGRLEDPNPACPNAAEHTPQPPGYVEWFAWAQRMSKTHWQQECHGCQRLNIWVPRFAAVPVIEEEPTDEH